MEANDEYVYSILKKLDVYELYHLCNSNHDIYNICMNNIYLKGKYLWVQKREREILDARQYKQTPGKKY